MKISIHSPLFLNEKGKRENNEDSIFPMPGQGTENEKLFIVCDGVGGIARGEVASRLACDSLSGYFSKNIVGATETDILKAFDFTQNQFDTYFLKEPIAKGMGTTLVMMHIHQRGLSVIHCGDSRFYHFHRNRIIWQTTDHTVVNELVKQGIITADEAASRPKSNRIIRAIQGNTVHKTVPDIHFIDQIEAGDLFFLCSDGVWETVSNADLTDIFSAGQSLSEKMDIIHTICEANSNDNFSAYLIEVKSVETETAEEKELINKFANSQNKSSN